MTELCGIDEAGRGPVIGPLVTAGVVIDAEDEPKLAELGVKDSKLILPKKREELFEKLIKMVKRYEIVVLSPQDIDAALIDPDTNLNWLEADTSAEVINKLKPEKVIVDCPSNNIAEYSDYIKKKLNVDCELIAEHKADMNHLVVGAASILAKVTRDRAIEEIKKEVGQDIGSGYPADPTTKQFILDNYDKHPKIFRKTWQTYKDVVTKKQQKGLDEF
ncbi:ribonuclease HII [Candidatus Woesearchaeota archaeon]|jgi:ribonuclease HII|nr:ribonuclease HII [Candidatus Woesearchaeota archaeon]